MTTTESIQHGTYSGYQKELKRGLKTCLECRAARAAYIRNYRRTWVVKQLKHQAKQHARDKALRRLAELHPQDMQRLYDEELRAREDT